MSEPRQGDLRVWHVPQVPGQPFFVPVDTPAHAIFTLAVLADYDAFQYRHGIKPDYSNASGIEVFDDGEWIDYHEEDDQ